MKKYLTMAVMGFLSLSAVAQTNSDSAGCTYPTSSVVVGGDEMMPKRVQARITAEEIFAAPANTVLDGPYTSKARLTGFQNSDLGRPGQPTRYYQAFHGCLKSVNSLRVIGMFNYFDTTAFDWFKCDSRGGMTADGKMTKPVNFEVSFYREDENGDPGEMIFRKHFDIIGRPLGIEIGMEGNMIPLYEFKIEDLGQEINLECGYMSFTATNMGDSPTCWFSLFTADSSLDHGVIDMGSSRIPATSPCVFSFMGDGKMAAQKALRVEKLTAPATTSTGTHEKVTVTVSNVGEQPVSDTRLELYLDGKVVATEDVYATIPVGGSYTYTFLQRVDVSAPGHHKVTVKNVTPGDENISRASASVAIYVYPEGETCASSSVYNDAKIFISKVMVDAFENVSQSDHYADYYATKEIKVVPGQTYTLSIEPFKLAVAGVWIDWNENGSFTDRGELVGYYYDKPLQFSVPEDFAVKAGKKRMRIVLDSSNAPQPCGKYYYGETEDYGIVVERNANTPAMQLSLSEISESGVAGSGVVRQIPIEIANTGTADLNAEMSVEYQLPLIYEQRSTMPARQFAGKLSVSPAEVKAAAPAADTTVKHVLGYDNGFDSGVGVGNYATAIFAQCYPASVIRTVKGMKLASVDVYISEVTGQDAKVKIFGQGTNGQAGKLLAEKVFKPLADSWNRIELDTPVTLDGNDIWYGVEFNGMQQNHYYIGIDAAPAVAGYGDLCCVDNSWWSMSELGINHNYCIRANLTGDRTATINWLNLDKNAVSVTPNGKAEVKASLSTAGLEKAVYEAKIKITSNDELGRVTYIPVYFTNGTSAGIVSTDLKRTVVKVVDGKILVQSEEEIANVSAYNMAGHVVANNGMVNSCELALDDMATGVYIVKVAYSDGASESFKVAVMR